MKTSMSSERSRQTSPASRVRSQAQPTSEPKHETAAPSAQPRGTGEGQKKQNTKPVKANAFLTIALTHSNPIQQPNAWRIPSSAQNFEQHTVLLPHLLCREHGFKHR